MNNINDKKNRKSGATRSYVAREIKEKVYTPEVLVNGVPYTYNEFLNLDHYEGEYVFPTIRNTFKVITDWNHHVTWEVSKEENYRTKLLADAVSVCILCGCANRNGLKNFDIRQDINMGFISVRDYDDYDSIDMDEFSVKQDLVFYRNENLNRAVKAQSKEYYEIYKDRRILPSRNVLEVGTEIVELGSSMSSISPYACAWSYKVFLQANCDCGAVGEVPSTPVISKPFLGKPGDLCTDDFIQIGAYPTEEQANNNLKYIETKFFRSLLAIMKVTPEVTSECFQFIPLQDFTSKSDIDWSKSIHEIDLQLYAKYGLSQKEIDFIEANISDLPEELEEALAA